MQRIKRFDLNLHMHSELLSAVNKYYPIGFPLLYKEYEGIQQIRQIIKDKIAAIESNIETPVSLLVSSLEKEFPELKIYDNSFFEFPSYQIEIDVESQVFNGIKLNVSICISISLLLKKYTVFINNVYNFRNADHIAGSSSAKNYDMVYFEDCKDGKLKAAADLAKNKVLDFFKDYEFTNHYILFSSKIKSGNILLELGREYGDEEYCYYDYLFGNNKWGVRPEILP
jgi:hypothetical protein